MKGVFFLVALGIMGVWSVETPLTGAMVQTDEGISRLGRVRLLRVGERASVALELRETITQIFVTKSAQPRTVAVEIGSVGLPVGEVTLEGGPNSQLVREVVLRDMTTPGRQGFVRVEIRTAAPVTSSVRLVGQHLYIDLVPALPAS